MVVKAASSPILDLIKRLVADRRIRELPDQELLKRFHTQQDQPAFHALMCRHGPMVLDVCHSILRNEADAEDAFQATFVILARKAGSIRNAASLGSWLHGVAYRTALKARAQSANRQKHEARAPARQTSAADELSWREVRQVLHAEVSGLPERYRAPLVLCYLEGATQEAAAVQLSLAKSTLRERLQGGRTLLRTRLMRRGLGPAALLVAAAWPAANLPASVPTSVVSSTIKAASFVAAGQAAAEGVISAKVATLTEGVMKTMFMTKLKIATALLLVVGIVIGAALLAHQPMLLHQSSAAQPTPEKKAEKPQTTDKGAKDAGAPDLAKIVRRIRKEPKYQSKSPRYCLLVFGPKAKDRVWLVMDGNTLYVDRNGNGDLTEKDKCIQAPAFKPCGCPAWIRERDIEVGDISVSGLTHSGLVLSQQEYRRKVDPAAWKKDHTPPAGTVEEWQEHVDKLWRQAADGVAYELCIRVDPKCYGVFGDAKGQHVKHLAFYDRHDRRLVFAKRREDAPVVHFGGPLTLDLRPGGKFRRGEDGEKVSFRLGTLGHGPGTFALMKLDLVP
jgi:RNA polymerase sigma factor (sigma-70 family)